MRIGVTLRRRWQWEAIAIPLLFFAAAVALAFEVDWIRKLLLNLPPALSILGLAVLARRIQGSWLAPGAFFALTWCVLVWTPLLLVAEADVWPWAVWWIGLSVAAVCVGSSVGMAVASRYRMNAVEPSPRVKWPALEWIVVLLTLIGLIAVFLLLRTKGVGFGVFMSLDRIAQVGRQFSVDRYSYGLVEPLDERLLTTATYLGALFGGLLFAYRRSGVGRWVAFVPLIPGISMALVLTTKASILFTIILMTGSYLAARVAATRGHEALFPWKRAFAVVGIGSGLLPVFVFTQLSRYGYVSSNQSQVAEVLARLKIFFLGYLGAFSSWLRDTGVFPDQLSLGAYSFAGVFDMMGIHPRAQGIYIDYVFIGPQGIPTNVFTIFRGLLEDYGGVGALLVLVVVGLVAGHAYGRLREGRTRSLSLLCVFYATTLASLTVNLFTYNTLLLAWILFALYVVAFSRRPLKQQALRSG